MSRARHVRNPIQKAFCIGCGCDDYHACVNGMDELCHWLAVDYPAGVGVCSACPGELMRWAAGERDPRPETAG